MIICHEHRFIFLKTRKTASTSLEIALSKLCGDKDTLTPLTVEDSKLRHLTSNLTAQNYEFPQGKLKRHSTAEYTKALIGDETWNSYFKFTFERNPFDKAVSLYHWRVRDLDDPPLFEDFVTNPQTVGLSNWHIYANETGILADRVCRYENFNAELEKIEEILRSRGSSALNGIFDNMPRAKSSFRKDRRSHRHFIGTRARRKIEEICQRELKYFGYSW